MAPTELAAILDRACYRQVAVANVVSQDLNLQLRLPGELQAYQDVALYPKFRRAIKLQLAAPMNSVKEHVF